MNHFPELDWLLCQGQLGCHDDKETKPHDVSCPVSSECCRCDVLRVTELGRPQVLVPCQATAGPRTHEALALSRKRGALGVRSEVRRCSHVLVSGSLKTMTDPDNVFLQTQIQ